MKRKLAVHFSMTVALTFTACSSSDSALAAAPGPDHTQFRGKLTYQLNAAEKLMSERKFDQASQIFEETLQKHPDDVNAQAGLATCLAAQFKLDAANERFDKILAADPQNAAAHAGKAMVALNRLQSSSKTIINNRNGILSDAESEARLATTADPGLALGHETLGRVFKEQGKQEEAYEQFKQAIAADPNYSAAYSGMGSIDLSENRTEEAIKDFRQAIALNSHNSSAHYGLGDALLKQGSVDEAIKELNTALYQFPNSAPVHLDLGKAFEAQGNIEAALKHYEHAVFIKPELSEAYARMAALHIALGKQAEAQNNTVGAFKEYKQALLIDPQNAEPYMRMADLREKRGDIELAVSEMRSGLDLNPQDTALRERIAQSLLKLGKLDESIDAFQTVLKQQPGNNEAVNGLTRALYLKAQRESQDSFLSSNEYENAESTLQEAIKLHPNDLQLRLALAKIHALSGKPSDFSKVAAPKNDAERISYAEALLAANRFSEASTQMRDVIAHANDPKQLLSVADLALTIKDLDSAETAYKKALTSGSAERARRGLAAVAKVRGDARRSLTLGQDLSQKKLLASAIDSYRQALFNDPRLAAAHLGLAKAEERFDRKSPTGLRDAASQYKAYLALAPDLPVKVRQKMDGHVQKIEAKASKIEAKSGAPRLRS